MWSRLSASNQVVRIGRLGQSDQGQSLAANPPRRTGSMQINANLAMKKHSEIADSLLLELKENVASRRVSQGIALLDGHAHLFTALDPEQKNAAAFVGYVAQWVDMGYREPSLVEELLDRFPKPVRGRLPVRDYLHLRTAEGLLFLLHDEPDKALFHFDLVLSMQ